MTKRQQVTRDMRIVRKFVTEAKTSREFWREWFLVEGAVDVLRAPRTYNGSK